MTGASAIYRGWVRHRRYEPRPHAFRYGLYLVYLDIDEIDHIFDGRIFWSVERPNLSSFRRRDYLRPADVPIREAVSRTIRAAGGPEPRGPIRILTSLRTLFWSFNPVSFYYAFDPSGLEVESVIAELTNTPWKERKSYVLLSADNRARNGRTLHEFAKSFHVSPYMPMNQTYRWRTTTPRESLIVRMENVQEGRRVFDATLVMRREPLSGVSLARALCYYPAMSMRVTAAIYWQALRLRLKRTPFFPHP